MESNSSFYSLNDAYKRIGISEEAEPETDKAPARLHQLYEAVISVDDEFFYNVGAPEAEKITKILTGQVDKDKRELDKLVTELVTKVLGFNTKKLTGESLKDKIMILVSDTPDPMQTIRMLLHTENRLDVVPFFDKLGTGGEIDLTNVMSHHPINNIVDRNFIHSISPDFKKGERGSGLSWIRPVGQPALGDSEVLIALLVDSSKATGEKPKGDIKLGNGDYVEVKSDLGRLGSGMGKYTLGTGKRLQSIIKDTHHSKYTEYIKALRVFKGGKSNLVTKSKSLQTKIKKVLEYNNSTISPPQPYGIIRNIPRDVNTLWGYMGNLLEDLSTQLRDIKRLAGFIDQRKSIEVALTNILGTIDTNDRATLPGPIYSNGQLRSGIDDLLQMMRYLDTVLSRFEGENIDADDDEPEFDISDSDYKLSLETFFSQSERLGLTNEQLIEGLYETRNLDKFPELKEELQIYFDHHDSYDQLRNDSKFLERIVSAIHLACYQYAKRFEYVLFIDQRSQNLNSYVINFKKYWKEESRTNLIGFIMNHFDKPGWVHELTIDKTASDGVKTGWLQ